jgi:hypothetical protein
MIVLLQFAAMVLATWVAALNVRPGPATLLLILGVGCIVPLLLLRNLVGLRSALVSLVLIWPAMIAAELIAHALRTCLQ